MSDASCLPELPDTVQALIDPDAMREFAIGTPREDLRAMLEAITADHLFGSRVIVDTEMARCCQAALWLANHFLDESHTISQGIATSSGSWWHGIMHRREGDFSNAKYWFRQVGDHPAYRDLADRCANVLPPDRAISRCWADGDWDPAAYVDFCQQATRDPGLIGLCNEVAWHEWAALFGHCFSHATSRGL